MKLSKKPMAALSLSLLLLMTGCHGAGDNTPSGLPPSSEASSLSAQGESWSPVAEPEVSPESTPPSPQEAPASPVQTGLVPEQILEDEEGPIHYSYYLPAGYNSGKSYPLVVTMPGYDRMWFGEASSGSNLTWNGFTAWTGLDEEIIVVSAQLTDWGETSARQAIQLTEYFLQNFSVDEGRIYAAGYSAGGETMSRAVAMRPDLYAAYLHGASQWDGDYKPVAENGVAVYIFMAEHDEYYGSQKARDAYDGLLAAYRQTGRSEEEIAVLLRLEIPDDAYFNSRGITSYHGGGSIVFDDQEVLNWILSQKKMETRSV